MCGFEVAAGRWPVAVADARAGHRGLNASISVGERATDRMATDPRAVMHGRRDDVINRRARFGKTERLQNQEMEMKSTREHRFRLKPTWPEFHLAQEDLVNSRECVS